LGALSRYVMAGLAPAIHVEPLQTWCVVCDPQASSAGRRGVDARDKPGHDDGPEL